MKTPQPRAIEVDPNPLPNPSLLEHRRPRRRMVDWLVAALLSLLHAGAPAHAEELRAALAQAGLPSRAPRVLAFSSALALVGTERGLYRWSPEDSSWVVLLAGAPIDDLAVLGDEVLIAAEGELYRWRTALAAPQRVALPPGSEVRSVAVDARGRGWVASGAGLFACRAEGAEFERVEGAPPDPERVRAAEGEVWVSAGRALWVEQPDGSFARRLAGLKDGWWELRASARHADATWLAVPEGVWRIDASGPERRPLSAPVVGAVRVETRLAIATEDGLYCIAGRELPDSLASAAALTRAVAMTAAPEGGVAVLDADGVRSLACLAAEPAVTAAPRTPLVLPPAAQVVDLQREMLSYLDLEPGRLRSVEGRARRRARLPEVALTFAGDMSRGRDHGRDQSVTTGRINDLLDASRSRDGGGEVRLELSWDLGEGAEPDALLAISRERRELIELREQILDRFNRVYFELWRARGRLAATPPASSERAELQLRVRELASVLDAWTGGAFSRMDEDQSRARRPPP